LNPSTQASQPTGFSASKSVYFSDHANHALIPLKKYFFVCIQLGIAGIIHHQGMNRDGKETV